jgi:hypothetical protein
LQSQPRLPDAGLALDKNELTAPLASLVQRVLEKLALFVAPDDDGAQNLAHRLEYPPAKTVRKLKSLRRAPPPLSAARSRLE